MSDYGDDYSDYGDEFYYVEDEYMMADDLAEHVIGSPPPVAYGDEDAIEDWDRFDYFNDLEYASDGYDDGKFAPGDTKPAKTGEKRKRSGLGGRSAKKRKLTEGYRAPGTAVTQLSPVVWRTQAERDSKTKLWDGNTESYALLKDWREHHADIPAWAIKSPHSDNDGISSKAPKGAAVPELLPPASVYEDDDEFEDVEEEEDQEGEEEDGIDPAILLQALQSRLAEAGGPIAGMDPQQMLQFAMRMMSNQDAGDDIAGELADQLLGGKGEEGDDDDDDDEDDEAPAGLLSWLDKQRTSNQDGEAATPTSPEVSIAIKRPPTPPSSEANRSIRALEETKKQAKGKNNIAPQKKHSLEVTSKVTRKRKADEAVVDDEDSTNATKRRATRSYDAPTVASQARAPPAPRATRSGRSKRS